ncbi:esterase-5B-like [Scaptodrosophila lebanonensis]|uniref:Carboxylic ester hydrolase n=1 Tax=Drosophila lebanonensis TaxID=7225 RepID=A0A6J2UEL0_DROLE|nr:esterase-5B-like [Scaptodrosophila lebanonensis]
MDRLFIWILLILSALTVNSQVIELPFGKLRGRDNGPYYSYESIPYAEPPLGELRFESPQPYRQKWESIFDATKPPEPCMQWDQLYENPENKSKLEGVEDCLTVNIYTPKANKGPHPVIVIIHGGCFMFGGVKNYDIGRFTSLGNAIVVAIAYRVGPLGFLSAEHKDLSGNNGLKDQRLALEWIHENIAFFGGDPQNVLLVGHSAGGASVNFQLLRPDFHRLAKAAVSVSGVALNPWAMPKQARERAFAIGDMLGCDHRYIAKKLKKCLQSKPAEDIVSTVQQFQVSGYVPFTMFGPVVEDVAAPNAFVTQHPRETMKSGSCSQVPWLVTYTKEDGGYNAATLLEKDPNTGQEIIEVLNTQWLDLAPHLLFNGQQGPSTYAQSLEIRQRYMGNRSFNIANYPALEKMFTDVLFKDGIEETMKLHRKHGRSPLYAFIYENPLLFGAGQILSKRTDYQFGTVHGDDFFLLFPLLNVGKELRPNDQSILDKFHKMLIEFTLSTSGDLQYGTCRFINNSNEPYLQLMNITSDSCQNVAVKSLP